MIDRNLYGLKYQNKLGRTSLVILCVLMLFVPIAVKAQNTMSVSDLEASSSSELILPIIINNQDAFVSFQLDLNIPSDFHYVEGSIELSARSEDHVVSVTILGESLIRILSYSMSNQVFSGLEGEVAHLKLNTSSQLGVYPLQISNAILGNSNSENILDSISSGSVSLNANALNKLDSIGDWIQCYPNPFNDQIQIHFQQNIPSEIQLSIYTVSMERLAHVSFQPGMDRNASIDFESLIKNVDDQAEGIYFFQFRNEEQCVTKKLIRLKK